MHAYQSMRTVIAAGAMSVAIACGSAGALAAADLQVRIPMAPEMDSLNVAAAGAVALHWLSRTEPAPA